MVATIGPNRVRYYTLGYQNCLRTNDHRIGKSGVETARKKGVTESGLFLITLSVRRQGHSIYYI